VKKQDITCGSCSIEKKYCDLWRLKNVELMVSDSSGVYRSERN